MSRDHWGTWLQSHWVKWCTDVNPIDVIPFLIERRCLTECTIQKIKCTLRNDGAQQAATELMPAIKRRPEAILTFMVALRQLDGYQDLLRKVYGAKDNPVPKDLAEAIDGQILSSAVEQVNNASLAQAAAAAPTNMHIHCSTANIQHGDNNVINFDQDAANHDDRRLNNNDDDVLECDENNGNVSNNLDYDDDISVADNEQVAENDTALGPGQNDNLLPNSNVSERASGGVIASSDPKKQMSSIGDRSQTVPKNIPVETELESLQRNDRYEALESAEIRNNRDTSFQPQVPLQIDDRVPSNIRRREPVESSEVEATEAEAPASNIPVGPGLSGDEQVSSVLPDDSILSVSSGMTDTLSSVGSNNPLPLAARDFPGWQMQNIPATVHESFSLPSNEAAGENTNFYVGGSQPSSMAGPPATEVGNYSVMSDGDNDDQSFRLGYVGKGEALDDSRPMKSIDWRTDEEAEGIAAESSIITFQNFVIFSAVLIAVCGFIIYKRK